MKNALVTGANRGLGLEFVRQLKDKGYYVIGCCRDVSTADELKKSAHEVIKLDVTSDDDIKNLTKTLENKSIDLLVNNAGIYGDDGVTVGNVDRENFKNVLDVNCISPIKLSDALLPNLKAGQEKEILVVTSRMGSISDNDRGRSYAYRTSKAALNCAMRSFAIDVEPMGIKVMLIHPGWVKTDLGGADAEVNVEESVSGMLEQAKLHFATSHAETIRRFDGGVISW